MVLHATTLVAVSFSRFSSKNIVYYIYIERETITTITNRILIEQERKKEGQKKTQFPTNLTEEKESSESIHFITDLFTGDILKGKKG